MSIKTVFWNIEEVFLSVLLKKKIYYYCAVSINLSNVTLQNVHKMKLMETWDVGIQTFSEDGDWSDVRNRS